MNLLRRGVTDHVETYLHQLDQLGKSQHTLRSYRGTLTAWVASGQSAEQWLLTISATQKRTSANQRRAVLNAYHNWLVRTGRAKTNPISRTVPASVPQRLLRTLTVPEVARLIDACQMVGRDKDTLVPTDIPIEAHRARLAAMVAVQVTSGLRVAELCRIGLGEYLEPTRWLRVIGKGNKERQVMVGRSARSRLREWDRWRTRTTSPYLFCTSSGEAINPRSYHRWLQDAARWAELEDVHPHTLRHTFATLAIESGIPVADVQQMLGHSQIATTMKYVHRAPERGWDRFHLHPLEADGSPTVSHPLESSDSI